MFSALVPRNFPFVCHSNLSSSYEFGIIFKVQIKFIKTAKVDLLGCNIPV